MALLDKQDPANIAKLSQLQGNILKGHGRDFTHNIFLKFKVGKQQEAKRWIASFAHSVTSTQRQIWESERFNRQKIKGDVFYGFLLSARGYKHLGFDPNKFGDKAFTDGMKNRPDLRDNHSKWDKGFRRNIDAMLLIADDDKARLAANAVKRLNQIEEFAEVVTIEYGNAIRNSAGDGIEHFGYVDGISQPLFFTDEVEDYELRNGGKNEFDPSAETDLVLLDDPFQTGASGSYFVFRKLEQNVKGFKEAEEELAVQLKLEGDSAERAGAMIVGRFEDGTPVTLSHVDGMAGSANFNNFNYKRDAAGAKCPFHGHIRKTNPRRDAADDAIRMARRGIPYGHRNISTEIEHEPIQMPESGVGLLFMSFQKSLTGQFEVIQNFWANKADFPTPGTGIDPIIGQDENPQDSSLNVSTGDFAMIYGDPSSKVAKSFNAFVTTKGGEYFFAPSITFLKNIV